MGVSPICIVPGQHGWDGACHELLQNLIWMLTNSSIQGSLQRAIAYHKAGQFAEAEAIYRQVLRIEPRNPDALNLLGLLIGDVGKPELAVDWLAAAVSSNPTIAQFHANLGEMYRRLARFNLAADSLRRALEIDPSTAQVHNTLGVVMKSLGKSRDAIAAFSQAVQRAPDFAEAQFNLGLALGDARRFKEAIAPLRRAVDLKPDDLEAMRHLGSSLMFAGELDEAEQILRSVVAKAPTSAGAYNDLGSCLNQKGNLAESSAMCRKALALDPNLDEAHWNLAIALLRGGDLAAGLPEYEWRLKNHWSVLKTSFARPRWDGGDLHGKTILLHSEQGLGDTLQFIRYLPLVADMGGRIYLRCQKELLRLLASFPHISRIISDAEELPEFDVYSPLLSLPLMFRTTLLSIPADVPYIQPSADLAKSWEARLGSRNKPLRVGLAWAGSRAHKDDARRSIDADRFSAFAALPNVQLHSLQKGPAAEDARQVPSLTDHAKEIHDVADLAALIAQIDLVVTVDTAVAHLAGAMAKPVWVLLPKISDWRWMMDRTDSPWYPTMRLFRQTALDRWDDVIGEVAVALSAFEPARRSL
jgi:tetratricopeptide (TPR) repeat protein